MDRGRGGDDEDELDRKKQAAACFEASRVLWRKQRVAVALAQTHILSAYSLVEILLSRQSLDTIRGV